MTKERTTGRKNGRPNR